MPLFLEFLPPQSSSDRGGPEPLYRGAPWGSDPQGTCRSDLSAGGSGSFLFWNLHLRSQRASHLSLLARTGKVPRLPRQSRASPKSLTDLISPGPGRSPQSLPPHSGPLASGGAVRPDGFVPRVSSLRTFMSVTTPPPPPPACSSSL